MPVIIQCENCAIPSSVTEADKENQVGCTFSKYLSSKNTQPIQSDKVLKPSVNRTVRGKCRPTFPFWGTNSSHALLVLQVFTMYFECVQQVFFTLFQTELCIKCQTRSKIVNQINRIIWAIYTTQHRCLSIDQLPWRQFQWLTLRM